MSDNASSNPLLPITPDWEVVEDLTTGERRIRVHGQYVIDNDTGKPAIFRPPNHLDTIGDFLLWNARLRHIAYTMSAMKPTNRRK